MNDNLRCAQQKIDCFNKEHPNACGCCRRHCSIEKNEGTGKNLEGFPSPSNYVQNRLFMLYLS